VAAGSTRSGAAIATGEGAWVVQVADETPRVRERAERVPPHNLEAEESLLGAMMLSRDAITAAMEVKVQPTDCYKPAHGHIFEAITSLSAAGEPADPVEIGDGVRVCITKA